jgi:hypothetical protein
MIIEVYDFKTARHTVTHLPFLGIKPYLNFFRVYEVFDEKLFALAVVKHGIEWGRINRMRKSVKGCIAYRDKPIQTNTRLVIIKDWGEGWDTFEQLVSDSLWRTITYTEIGIKPIANYRICINNSYVYEIMDEKLFMLGVIKHGIVYQNVI